MEINNCNNCIWNGTCNKYKDAYTCEYYSPIDETNIAEEEYVNDLHIRVDDYRNMIAEYSDSPAEI